MKRDNANTCLVAARDGWYAVLTAVCLSLFAAAAVAAGSTDAAVPLTAAERAWLTEHPVIRLAPDPDFPPIEFIDEQGRYQGIAADYAALVERKLGIKITIVPLKTWDEVLHKAQSREIDMLGAASKSPQRAEYMTFTRPHIQLPGVIIVRKEVAGRLQPKDLLDKKVAVVSGYIWQDLLLNDYPDLSLHKVPDLKTGLKETSFGSVDALVANLATASWYIQREGITNLRVAGETGYFGRYAFATRKDWPELNSILEKALAAVTPEEHQQILQRWVAVDATSPWLNRTSVGVIAGIVALLLMILAWNRILKSQVRQRTRDLERQLEQRREAERALDKANSELERRVSERTARLEQSNARLRDEVVERERVQEDLRRFQMTLDETLDCVFMFDDTDLRFFYVNRGAVDQVGYGRDELLGMRPFDIKPEFTEEKFRAFIAPFLERRETALTFETVHQHKGGGLIPVEIFLQYIAPEGEAPRFVAIVHDISDRKRIEAELNWKNRQVDIISRAQSAFIAHTDSRASFETLLTGLLELADSEYGFIGEVLHTADDLPYLRTHAITNIAWDEATRSFYAEHAPQGMEFTNLESLFGAALKTGEPVIANDPANDSRSGGTPPGHPPLNAFLGIPLYAGKEMVGMAGIANRTGGYDARLVESLSAFSSTCAHLIVEYRIEQQRIAAEERVKHNEQRLRAVLDNVLESIISIDRRGIVQSVNTSSEQIFGYGADEMIGQNVKMLMPEPHRSAHDQYLQNYHNTRDAKIIGTGREVEGRHKDGTIFPLELSVTEVAAGGQTLYVGVLRDITERKQTEVELHRARIELQQANEKLLEQARTDALTGISNRRHFDEALDLEIRRAGRAVDAPLSLILCDIDHFKLYNDVYGHVAGDECLHKVAAVIRSVFKRVGDLVARYGGEEFAVIMPATNAENAAVVAERMRLAIWERSMPHTGSRVADRVTLSIGVATLRSGEVMEAKQFAMRADEALYMAKANGRNRVEQHFEDTALATNLNAN
jgi:diguanylate cyclase (GGDEF)-like protein/PAS domain S-box-containing protein